MPLLVIADDRLVNNISIDVVDGANAADGVVVNTGIVRAGTVQTLRGAFRGDEHRIPKLDNSAAHGINLHWKW